MNFEAVLFDMNGVLIDDENLHEAAFRTVLESLGLTLTPEDYKKYYAGRTDIEGFERYFTEIQAKSELDKLIKLKEQAYLELVSSDIKAYDGVKELVEQLAYKGIKLAVVTGSIRKEATMLLSRIGIQEAISALVTAEDVEKGKPSPEGYIKAAELLGVRPSNCAVVEDAPPGIIAAKRAGMYCVAITNTHSALELSNADKVVDTLSFDMLNQN